MSDLIDRQAAIDICRAPHMRNADCSDFEMAIMMLPPAQPEPCEDAVSRAEAKKILYDFAGHIVDTPNGIYQQAYKTYMSKMDKLPSVTPKQLAPDQNGDLWITVPDIDKVTCIYVQESKSKFCRIFYEEQEQSEPYKVVTT